MEVQEKKVFVNDLTLGMYVSRLDRPWLETPFTLQGFLIISLRQIDEIERFCRFVYVDQQKSRTSVASKNANKDDSVDPNRPRFGLTAMPLKHGTYAQIKAFDEETLSVKQVSEQVNKTLIQVTAQISKGARFDPKNIKNIASEIVSSVIRNPDVFACLARVKEKDDYLHHHSIRCSIWAALLGRHIGLRRLDLEILTQAILLKDLGKTRLPELFITKPYQQLNSEQRIIYKKHVAITVKIIEQITGLNPKIMTVIASHCERYDGSGFPRRQKGDEIPLLSIIAGLATHYDQLINPRALSSALCPSDALSTLYQHRNQWYQEDVILEFIQALGLYPAGSVVELSTGELAVVVEQYAERRLRPRVVVVTDKSAQPSNDLHSIDLLTEAVSRQEFDQLKPSNPLPCIDILRDLKVNDYDFDLLKVREKLFIPNKKRFGFFSFKNTKQ